MSSGINPDIEKYAQLQRTPLSIDHMLRTGTSINEKSLLISSLFLKNELAIRIARTIVELQGLPTGLLSNRPIQWILKNHLESFNEIVGYTHLLPPTVITSSAIRDSGRFLQGVLPPPHSWSSDLSDIAPTNEEQATLVACEENFVQLLSKIKSRHRGDPVFLGLGLQEFRGSVPSFMAHQATQDLMDSFNRGRIGIRLLIGQHVALATDFRAGLMKGKPTKIGIIDTKCDVVGVIEQAWDLAMLVCQRHYGSSVKMPAVEFRTPKGNPRPTFVYIPTILHHIVYELLKNSLRATIDHHQNSLTIPPIRIIISSGKEDMIIKISDQGGGVSRSDFEGLQTYFQSKNPVKFGYDEAVELAESLDDVPPRDNFSYGMGLSSFGVGIPLSKLYAEYLGGSLELLSMEGFGTDAYIHLMKISNVVERLADEQFDGGDFEETEVQ